MYAKKYFGYKTISLVYINNNCNLGKSQGKFDKSIGENIPFSDNKTPLFLAILLYGFSIYFQAFPGFFNPKKCNGYIRNFLYTQSGSF